MMVIGAMRTRDHREGCHTEHIAEPISTVEDGKDLISERR